MNILAQRQKRLNALMPEHETRNMLMRQAMMDNASIGSVGAPSGLQPNPRGPTGRDAFTEGLQLSSFVPVVGDAAGLAGDIRMMATQPETRTFPNALMTLAGALPFIPAMTVFHGSPHKFDAFDMKKIGTGEGAQAYGHGLYFAESPDVARQYRADRGYVGRFMKDGLQSEWTPERIAQHALDQHGDNAADMLRKTIKATSSSKNPAQIASNKELQKAVDMLESGTLNRGGAFYEVDLPDEAIEKMLDWDAPLSEQPENVKRVLSGLTAEDVFPNMAGDKTPMFDQHTPMNKVYRDIAYGLGAMSDPMQGQRMASDFLSAKGIPGIKYYDGMSRQGGKGTRNFVVFDDKLPKILKRE